MSTVSRPVVAPANTHLPRDYALFRTPYRVGLRSEEAALLDQSDVPPRTACSD
jgi:hypothetical protein